MKQNLPILAASLAAFSASVASAQANQWLLISDFENGEQELADKFHVEGNENIGYPPIFAVLPDPVVQDNSVFWWDPNGHGVVWNISRMHATLPEPIPEGAVGTLYARLYAYGLNVVMNMGISDVPIVPADPVTSDLYKTFNDGISIPLCQEKGWSDFEAQSEAFRSSTAFGIRDGGKVRTTDVTPPLNTWIEIWLVADNANDQTKLFWRVEGDTEIIQATVLGTDQGDIGYANFRNGTTDSLSVLSMGGAAGNPASPNGADVLFWDDISVYVGAEMLETPNFDGGGETWAGYPVRPDGWVDTGSWLGWVGVSDKPWIWIDGLSKYAYIDDTAVTTGGGWAYVMR